MDIYKEYLNKLLLSKNVSKGFFDTYDIDTFIQDYEIKSDIDQILTLQKHIMKNWEVNHRKIEFNDLSIQIPNGTQGVSYEFKFDESFIIQNKLAFFDIIDLEDIGLIYDKESLKIKGKPSVNGTLKIKLLYKVEGESEIAEATEKLINLVINADPKTLWKNLPSDQNALYWKEDNRSSSENIGRNKIVISSKRGRSHQNVGSFRDDDYSFKHFDKTGWTVVAVSDGAGSYPFSRKGSQLACDYVINHFENDIDYRELLELEDLIVQNEREPDNSLITKSKQFLYKAVLSVFKQLDEFAKNEKEKHPEEFNHPKAKLAIDHFHSTLIFCLFKKFEFGYVFMTFGVGDCPIGYVNKDKSKATLLNWLDVGEFGGGTRFITQQQIFSSKEHPMSSRFKYHVVDDFSFLFLMTDGIYDAKFIVEANLEKTENWLEFINDLEGENEDGINVDFSKEPSDVEEQLNQWMDFWSKGNHDDRTLAIIY